MGWSSPHDSSFRPWDSPPKTTCLISKDSICSGDLFTIQPSGQNNQPISLGSGLGWLALEPLGFKSHKSSDLMSTTRRVPKVAKLRYPYAPEDVGIGKSGQNRISRNVPANENDVRRISLRQTPEKGHGRYPKQRIATYERLWEEGGFALTHGNCCDLMTDVEVSHAPYNFWRDKVRKKILKSGPDSSKTSRQKRLLILSRRNAHRSNKGFTTFSTKAMSFWWL